PERARVRRRREGEPVLALVVGVVQLELLNALPIGETPLEVQQPPLGAALVGEDVSHRRPPPRRGGSAGPHAGGPPLTRSGSSPARTTGPARHRAASRP